MEHTALELVHNLPRKTGDVLVSVDLFNPSVLER